MANVISILIQAKDEASAVLAGVKEEVSHLGPSFEQSAEASRQFALGLGITGVAAGALVGYGAKVAGNLESWKQGFVTLLGSTQAANAAIKMIQHDAATTPFEMTGLVQANMLLTGVTHNAGQSEQLLMNVGKALAAMGKGQPELDRVVINLQQIGTIGHAQMVDLKQFAYDGIPIFDMLKKQTGLAGSALNDFITNGGVTFQMLTDMFNKAGSAGGQFANAFTSQAGTFNQLVSNMKDNFDIFASNLITKTGVFDFLKQAIARLVNFMSSHQDLMIRGIKDLLDFVRANGPVIAGILVGALTPAFLSLAIAVGSAALALLPWIAAGAAAALVARALIAHVGGLAVVTRSASLGIKAFFAALKDGDRTSDGFVGLMEKAGIAVRALILAFQEGDVTSDGFVGVMERIGNGLRDVTITARLLKDTLTGGDPTIKASEASFAGVARALATLRENLIPVAKFIRDQLSSAFEALWVSLKTNLFPALERLAPLLKPIGIGLLVMAGISFAALVGAIWLVANTLRVVADVIGWLINVSADLWHFQITVAKDVAHFFMQAAHDIAQAWTDSVQAVKSAAVSSWQAVYAVVSAVMGAIWQVVSAVWAAIWRDAIKPVLDVATTALRAYLAVYTYIFDVIRGVALVTWWAVYRDAVAPVISAISTALSFLAAVASLAWQMISNAAVSAWQTTRNAAVSAWQFIYNNVVAPTANAIATSLSFIAAVASLAWQSVSSFAVSSWQRVYSVWAGVAGWFAGIWASLTGGAQSAGNSISSIFSRVANDVSGAFRSAVNWIVDRINGLIHSLNGTVGKLPGVPKIPDVVHPFAQGGLVTQPTVGLVGEDGPEAIIPLNKPARAAQIMRQAGLSGGGVTFNQTNHIYNQVDMTAANREIGWRLARA